MASCPRGTRKINVTRPKMVQTDVIMGPAAQDGPYYFLPRLTRFYSSIAQADNDCVHNLNERCMVQISGVPVPGCQNAIFVCFSFFIISENSVCTFWPSSYMFLKQIQAVHCMKRNFSDFTFLNGVTSVVLCII